jgi:chemotaxis protein CheD
MTVRAETVGMAEIKCGAGAITYTCLGLGSCVSVQMLDPQAGVSVVGHVMLPHKFPHSTVEMPGKFADTAVPEMRRLLEELGGNVAHTKVSCAGGAQVFQYGAGALDGRLQIGQRNIEAIAEALSGSGFTIHAKDVGGHAGRTVVFDAATGSVRVRSLAQGERELCNMRNVEGKAA